MDVNEISPMLRRLADARQPTSKDYKRPISLQIWDDDSAIVSEKGGCLLLLIKASDDLAKTFSEFIEKNAPEPSWQNDMQMLKDYFDHQSDATPQWRLINRLEAALEEMSARCVLHYFAFGQSDRRTRVMLALTDLVDRLEL